LPRYWLTLPHAAGLRTDRAHPELRLRHDEGETVVPGPVLTDPTAITRPVDLVFIAVKTTQNADSAGRLRALCDENTVVCALQNGVEQKAQLEPLVSGATVLPSVVWFPAQREPDASVWLRAKPRLTLPDAAGAAGGGGASRYAL
jgi:2-dehydropantoate 2-reductase